MAAARVLPTDAHDRLVDAIGVPQLIVAHEEAGRTHPADRTTLGRYPPW